MVTALCQTFRGEERFSWYKALYQAWMDMQRQLARQSPRGEYIVATTAATPSRMSNPALVIDVVRRVVAAAATRCIELRTPMTMAKRHSPRAQRHLNREGASQLRLSFCIATSRLQARKRLPWSASTASPVRWAVPGTTRTARNHGNEPGRQFYGRGLSAQISPPAVVRILHVER